MLEMLPGVSSSRITPSRVPANFLMREALLRSLNEPAPRVTYVIAPSGYGKTALAAQWAAQHPSTTAWYTASASDSVLDTVLSIMQSFRNIFPGFTPQLTEERIRTWSPVEITRIGCNELAKIEETVNLVIDESHVWSEDHAAILGALSENVPDNVRILMLRATPPTSAPSPAASRRGLVIWGVDELKFSGAEISAVIEQHGLNNKNLELISKLREIDGWPLGVYIVSTSGQFGVSDLLEGSSSSLRSKHEIFIDHAIDCLPESYRTILQEFCLVPEINMRIVSEISDFPLVTPVLRRMVQQGQYLSYLGSDTEVFSINPLIRAALIERVKMDPVRYQQLAERSARALIKDGRAFEALDLLEIAGEKKLLALTVAGSINDMIFTGQSDLLRKWKFVGAKANVIGPIAVDQLDAYADLISGNVEKTFLAANRLSREAEALGVSEIVKDDLALFKARLLFAAGELRQCVEFSLEYLRERVSKDPNFPEKASFILRLGGGSAFLLGCVDELFEISRLEERILSEKQNVNPYLQLRPIGLLAEMTIGNCRTITNTALLARNQMSKLRGICGSYEAAYSLAEVMREQGDESQALLMIQPLLEEAISFQIWPWAVALLSKRALVKHQQQRTSEALEDIRTARTLLVDIGAADDAYRVIDMHEALIRLSLNDGTRLDEIRFRLDDSDEPSTLLYSSARAQILNSIALAEASLLYPSIAREHLQKALAIGMENGYREIFLSNSPSFLNLLISEAGQAHTIYLEDLASEARMRIRRLAETSENLQSPLTKRELEILRSLSTGMTIFEISRILHISHNTMKTHLKSVYKKLRVDGRETAVAKGKELVLI